jgi:P-type Na+/K+ transporter
MAKDKKEEEKAIAAHVSGQSNKPMSVPAHALAIDGVASELGADIQNGLSHEEAKKRLEEFGRNEFGENKGVQPARILVAQIANALTLVSAQLLQLHQPTVLFLQGRYRRAG